MWKNLLKKLKNPESLVSFILGIIVVILAGFLLFNAAKNRANNSTLGQSSQELSNTPGIPVGEKVGVTFATGLPATHTVKEGEDLWTIAITYYKSGYNWKNIADENKLSNPDQILVGQKLTIPKADPILPVGNISGNGAATIAGDTYKVKQDDTLWTIACNAYNDCYKWPEIAKANNIASPDTIEVDQELKLPR